MKKTCFVILAPILIVYVLHSYAIANDKHLGVLDFIIQGDFNKIVKFADLSEANKAAFYELIEDSRIAELGERYNETDVVDLRLPMRQFVGAGENEEQFFIAYHRGGFAPQTKLIIFKKTNPIEKEILMSLWNRNSSVKSFNDVIELVSDGHYAIDEVENEYY